MDATGGAHGGQAPYIARESELERLRRRLQEASAGRGGLLLLRGPAGTGLTRTAHEVAAHADRLGMLVLWGHWAPGTLSRPYGALAEALEEYGLSLAAGRLGQELGEESAVLVRLAPRLAGVLQALTPAAPLPARDERLRLQLAVLRWLVRATSDQPLLLVLDDAQWADGDSLRLLQFLAARTAGLPLLILAAKAQTPALSELSEDPNAQAVWQRLEDEKLLERVELAGLDAGALAATLAPHADEPPSGEAVALIHELSGGIPLHARELYRHLHEENRLNGVRGHGLPAVTELPETFEELVAWRVARLSPEVRSALSALAGFHRGASTELIAEVGQLSRSRVIDFMEAAAAGGFCRVSDGGRRYVLTHDRFRAALLLRISALQRAQLHRRVAEALEAQLGGQAREAAAELVHHYHLSAELEDGGRGIRHALLAAEQSRAAYAHLRAVRCLSLGLALAAPHEHDLRAELGVRLAQAQAEAGLAEEAVESAAAAVQQQRQAGFGANLIVEELVATLRLLRGDGLDAAELPGEELRRLALEHVGRAAGEHRPRLELLGERWQELRVGGVATLFWETAAPEPRSALAERAAESETIELLLGQRSRVRQETAQVAAYARAWRHPAAVLRALRAVSCDLTTRHGLFREAAGWAQLYAQTAARYGAERDRVGALLLLARCQAAVGHLAAVGQTLAEARERLAAIPDDRDLQQELVLSEAVAAHYLDGDWRDLGQRLQTAVEDPRPAGLALFAHLALARIRSGQAEESLELLPDLLEACAQLPPLTYYRDSALLATLAGVWELGAGEHAARGRMLLEVGGASQLAAQLEGTPRLARARLFALAGDLFEARPLFREERAALEAAELHPLRAILDHDEGVSLAAAETSLHRQAAALLERAGEQFEQLGMSGWRDRTQQLLADGFESAARPGGRLHFTYPRGLSRREADLVRLLAGGSSLSDAASALGLAPDAAERHLASALEKVGADSVESLPAAARRHGFGGAS